MLIKKESPNLGCFDYLVLIKSKIFKKKILLILLICSFILCNSLIMIYYGMKLYKTGKAETLNDFFHNLVVTKFKIFNNYYKGMISNPEKIYFDIKFKDFQKLEGYRKIALDRGYIGDFKDIDIPALFTHNGKSFKVKLQMTGWNMDHLTHEKWSFRVKTKSENTFLGMKEFSILRPRTRGHLSEWIGHMLEKKEKLISLRFDYVNVFINGIEKRNICFRRTFR
jgi:hypothetical protein